MESIRKARCVFNEKALKTDIYSVLFPLKALFSFLQKRSNFLYGTARANAFFRIDLF
jgi:hypothetical protein